jgi:hypothetical protein
MLFCIGGHTDSFPDGAAITRRPVTLVPIGLPVCRAASMLVAYVAQFLVSDI